MYSLLIKNAKVVDGSGAKPQVLDVAVQGDEIVNLDHNIAAAAETVIDAQGKVLTPGFVDLQNHSDVYWQIFDNPELTSLISQGFTTAVLGNCGASLAPLLSHQALLSMQKWHALEGLNTNWQSFSEYIEQLAKQRFSCNLASLVGYSTLRRGLVGDQVRPLEKDELAVLTNALEESLDAGAFGLSSGLSYAHEIIVSELELYKLAAVVKKYKGLFSLHLRNESGEVAEAVDEALEIARSAEVNFKISHFKIRGAANWHKLDEVVENLETAYHKGLNIHFDLYPYDTTWQALYSYMPKWAVEGGRTALLKHFADPTQRNKILSYLNNSETKFPQLQIASTTNKLNFSGKKISQIAKNLELTSEETVLHLIQNGGSEVLVFEQNLDNSQVKNLLAHPLSFVASDGGGFPANINERLVHPRCFGTAPKFLQEVLEDGSLTLEQAVMKLTSGPAKKIGLKKRGEIKIGYYADLVLLEPEKVKASATYENPFQLSQGISYVFVNGKAVVAEGQVTASRPGYVLRRS